MFFIISLAYCMPLVCGELKIMVGSPLSWTKDAAFSDLEVPLLWVTDPCGQKAIEGLWLLL